MISSLLSYLEMEKGIKDCHRKGQKAIAYLPVGCIEQHGPFLPVETDSLIAKKVAEDMAICLEGKKYWGYVFPTIHYTPTQSNINYIGTISIPDENFRNYARQVCAAIMKSPFDALAVVSGHGPADHSLKEIGFWQVNEQFEKGMKPIRPVITMSISECSTLLEKRFRQKPGRHADWREFLMLYLLLGEEYFDKDRLNALKSFKQNNNFIISTSSIYGVPVELRSTQGVIGEPLPNCDADLRMLAEELWNYLIKHLSEGLHNELKSFFESGL